MTEKHIVPIIMAGGSGTRLWPLSRDTMPKQFIPLLDFDRSPFQDALLRLSGPAFERPIVVTHHDFRFIVAEQMAAVGVEADIVLEPTRRDSAAAVAAGALLAAERAPHAICIACASDHLINDPASFRDDCIQAAAIAGEGLIVTLGITATQPSAAYGYIEPGDALGATGGYRLTRFVEKPTVELAETYIARGLLWNSGNFIFPARMMLEEIRSHAPETLAAVRAAIAGATRDLDFIRLDHPAFSRAPMISIDHAVMEHCERAAVLRANFGWSDIGSWDAIHGIKKQDEARNVIEGSVCAIDCSGSLMCSEEILTTAIDVNELIIVTTRDAVLVAPMSSAAKVKSLVEKMKRENRPEGSEHLKAYRPWGWYQRIDIGPRFQVKHIGVKPGGILSLQKHHHRAEHWVVVSGTAEVHIDGKESLVHENEAVYLPIGCTHRLRNPGKIPLELIEVQVGSYTGEDDIIRLEDVYARA